MRLFHLIYDVAIPLQVHLERFGNRSFVYPSGPGFHSYDTQIIPTGSLMLRAGLLTI